MGFRSLNQTSHLAGQPHLQWLIVGKRLKTRLLFCCCWFICLIYFLHNCDNYCYVIMCLVQIMNRSTIWISLTCQSLDTQCSLSTLKDNPWHVYTREYRVTITSWNFKISIECDDTRQSYIQIRLFFFFDLRSIYLQAIMIVGCWVSSEKVCYLLWWIADWVYSLSVWSCTEYNVHFITQYPVQAHVPSPLDAIKSSSSHYYYTTFNKYDVFFTSCWEMQEICLWILVVCRSIVKETKYRWGECNELSSSLSTWTDDICIMPNIQFTERAIVLVLL